MSNWFRVYGFADVQDRLLVGAYPLDREDVGMLEWMNVERVLNLVQDKEYAPGEREAVEDALAAAGIEERRISLTDYGRLPAPELEHAVREIVDWLDQGHRVYVHCRAGWQRSAAVAAGVVAVREGVGIEHALELVRQRKPSADPLPKQRDDLLRWWEARDPGRPSDAGDEKTPAAEPTPDHAARSEPTDEPAPTAADASDEVATAATGEGDLTDDLPTPAAGEGDLTGDLRTPAAGDGDLPDEPTAGQSTETNDPATDTADKRATGAASKGENTRRKRRKRRKRHERRRRRRS